MLTGTLINVVFTVGAELMGIWVPDNDTQAYAARRVLQSVIAAAYGLHVRACLRLTVEQ